MTTQADLQAALERYQAATETTYQRTKAWEDAKAAEVAARLAMNNSTREEETAAKELLTIIADPSIVLIDLDDVTLPTPPPVPGTEPPPPPADQEPAPAEPAPAEPAPAPQEPTA